MKNTFEILKTTRNNFIKILDYYSLSQLNEIPSPFRNNLFWNIAHCLVTQQLLVYTLSGEKPIINEDFINRYRKGTFPDQEATEEDLQYLKDHLVTTVDKCQEDYEKGLFTQYKEYETSYGFVIKSTEAAIEFNNSHEALHLGDVLMIRKFLSAKV